MDFNKLAQEIYQTAFQDELRKLAQEKGSANSDSYIPALAAAVALPMLMNEGSILGRKAGLQSIPVADWIVNKTQPTVGIPKYLKNTIGARSVLPHAGTLAGALTGAGGAALLYSLLKDYY